MTFIRTHIIPRVEFVASVLLIVLSLAAFSRGGYKLAVIEMVMAFLLAPMTPIRIKKYP